MTTTAQTVVDRAKARSPLNPSLTNDRAEMLAQIRAIQQNLFTELASETRDRFLASAGVSSSSGSSGRVFDLTIAPFTSQPVERVLKLQLTNGIEVSPVDVLDVDAELAPRYIVKGQTLVEVSNDWGASGVVTATLTYVYGMTDIDPTGLLTQVISVPDQWAHVIWTPLTYYLFSKDTGRDPAEGEALLAEIAADKERFKAYLENYGGVEARRFVQPVPRTSSGRK